MKNQDTSQVEQQSPSKNESGDVIIPEAFQKEVVALLEGKSKQEIDFIQNLCSEKMNKFYKAEREEEFSTDDMPKSD